VSVAKPVGDERDPWLSPDGRTLFFTSDRGSALGSHEVTGVPPLTGAAPI
jgi:Tol biopolymer transport system component